MATDPIDDILANRGEREFWNATLANLGQMVASIPERRARAAAMRMQMEQQAQNAELRRGELQVRQQALQQQQATQSRVAQMDQAVNKIVSEAMFEAPDGTRRFDRKRLVDGFARVQAPLDTQVKVLKALDDVEESGSKLEEARREHAARVLNAVIEAPDTHQAMLMGIAEGVGNNWLKKDEAGAMYQLMESGQDPKPRLKQLRDTLSDKYREKEQKLSPGERVMRGTEVIAENPPLPKAPTEASLAADAAGGDPEKALELLHTAAARNPTEASIAMQAANGDPVKALRLMQTIRPTMPVVVQTAEGPQLVNRGTGTATPIKTAGGETVQPPPTAEMRNKEKGRELAAKSVTAIESLSKKVITKRGIAQRAIAAGRSIESVLGNDPDFRVYQDARRALAGNLAVAQQGSRPSDADIKLIWLPLVPDVFADTDESMPMKWDLVRTMSGISKAPKRTTNPYAK